MTYFKPAADAFAEAVDIGRSDPNVFPAKKLGGKYRPRRMASLNLQRKDRSQVATGRVKIDGRRQPDSSRASFLASCRWGLFREHFAVPRQLSALAEPERMNHDEIDTRPTIGVLTFR